MLLALLMLQGTAEALQPQFRFQLVWEIREERVIHSLRFEDEKGEFQITRFEGYRPVAGDPISFDCKKLRDEVGRIYDELRAVPDLAHTSSTFSGVQISLSVENRGEKGPALCRAFNYYHPGLEKLYRAASAALGDSSRPAFEPLLSLSRFRDRKSWEYEPGTSPKQRLLEPIDPLSSDLDLRRLALATIAEEEIYDFLPKLRAVFEASMKQDGEGDYFLALALLRLGEIEGIERVLAVAQSAHPEWALEASGALESGFREIFGRAIIPPYDFFSPGDPRPAAVEAFRVWLSKERTRLTYSRDKKRFLKSAESKAGA